MALMRTDRRRNFKQLPSRVTLLSAVEDGVYVSDQERTYFMGGGDPGEAVLLERLIARRFHIRRRRSMRKW